MASESNSGPSEVIQTTRPENHQTTSHRTPHGKKKPFTQSVNADSHQYVQTGKRRRPRKRKRKNKDTQVLSHDALLQKLHQALPDRIIGEANECDVLVNDVPCVGLIDTGSMVSTVSQTFFETHLSDLMLHPLDDLLSVKNASGDEIPYLGYVEVSVQVTGSETGLYPLLVVRDTPYNVRVPLLVGRYQHPAQIEGGPGAIPRRAVSADIEVARCSDLRHASTQSN